MLKRLLGLFDVMSAPSSASHYEEGQVWSYKTRPQEVGSRVLILKIDVEKNNQKIFHIRIDGVKMRNPYVKGGIQANLQHVPISEAALSISLKRLISEVRVLPDYSEGYAMWRKAFDKGEGGVFSVSVSEVLEVIEKTVNG